MSIVVNHELRPAPCEAHRLIKPLLMDLIAPDMEAVAGWGEGARSSKWSSRVGMPTLHVLLLCHILLHLNPPHSRIFIPGLLPLPSCPNLGHEQVRHDGAAQHRVGCHEAAACTLATADPGLVGLCGGAGESPLYMASWPGSSGWCACY
jgi:hypothetical protein